MVKKKLTIHRIQKLLITQNTEHMILLAENWTLNFFVPLGTRGLWSFDLPCIIRCDQSFKKTKYSYLEDITGFETAGTACPRIPSLNRSERARKCCVLCCLVGCLGNHCAKIILHLSSSQIAFEI